MSGQANPFWRYELRVEKTLGLMPWGIPLITVRDRDGSMRFKMFYNGLKKLMGNKLKPSMAKKAYANLDHTL